MYFNFQCNGPKITKLYQQENWHCSSLYYWPEKSNFLVRTDPLGHQQSLAWVPQFLSSNQDYTDNYREGMGNDYLTFLCVTTVSRQGRAGGWHYMVMVISSQLLSSVSPTPPSRPATINSEGGNKTERGSFSGFNLNNQPPGKAFSMNSVRN